MGAAYARTPHGQPVQLGYRNLTSLRFSRVQRSRPKQAFHARDYRPRLLGSFASIL